MTSINLILELIMLGFLLACCISIVFCKNLFTVNLIFMSFSLVISALWLVLQGPDLAITEAAVGAGVDTLLIFLVLRKVNRLNDGKGVDDDE